MKKDLLVALLAVAVAALVVITIRQRAEIARLQGLLESSYSAPVINLRPADDRRRLTGSEPAGQFAH